MFETGVVCEQRYFFGKKEIKPRTRVEQKIGFENCPKICRNISFGMQCKTKTRTETIHFRGDRPTEYKKLM